PVTAVVTAKPEKRRLAESSSRMFGSSSTTSRWASAGPVTLPIMARRAGADPARRLRISCETVPPPATPVCEGVSMLDQIVIGARFNGPPDSGNGGYSAGLAATAIGAESTGATVTLRRPPPLEVPLRVRHGPEGATVLHDDHLVAEVTPAALDEEAVPAVPYDRAVAVSVGYPGFADHPFPTCYVCGPERGRGDGLRIFPGPLPDGRAAAPWQVPEDVTAVTLWAALDCPGGWAIVAPGRPYVMGRMTARVLAVPDPGTECVVLGAVVTTEGRKAEVRSAVYDG